MQAKNRNSAYDEKTILTLIAQGNERAFVELYDNYRPFIYNVAHKLVSDTEVVKEVLQDVFMEVWRRREKLSEIQNFRAYLYMMARNVIFDHLKQQVAASQAVKELSYRPALENTTEVMLLEKQYGELLQAAVAKLPPQQKEVFLLARIEGLNQTDIAARMGVKRLTVKAHMQRALHTIRILLEPHLSTVLALFCLLSSQI